ncbi:MAG: NERD domain-containing protein, partial [Solirubrobacteraceae bacterium]
MAARRSTLGVPGASARAQYLRRQAAREQRSAKSVQPHHELAWLLGAEGEELLADMLSESLADCPARLLHDRRVPSPR